MFNHLFSLEHIADLVNDSIRNLKKDGKGGCPWSHWFLIRRIPVPYVSFRPSRSVAICTGPESSINKQERLEKAFFLVLQFCDFF